MNFNLDLTTDFEVFDNTERVELRRLVDGTLQSAEVVEDALRHQVTEAEAQASGGDFTTQDVVWNLPRVQVLDRPKPGSQVIEDNSSGETGDPTTWTVLSVDWATLSSRYRCTCRDLVLAFGLTEKVTVLAPNATQDSAGAWTPTFTAVYTDISAKFQEVDGSEVRERGKRATLTNYKVFVGQRLTLSIEYRIRDQAGVLYELVSWETPDQIAELQTLNVRRVR